MRYHGNRSPLPARVKIIHVFPLDGVSFRYKCIILTEGTMHNSTITMNKQGLDMIASLVFFPEVHKQPA